MTLNAPCKDCGVDTAPITGKGCGDERWGRRDALGWEYYMVHNVLWDAAGGADGFLCIGCLELRLGRMLTPDDFANLPINGSSPWDTARLANRKRPRSRHGPQRGRFCTSGDRIGETGKPWRRQ